MTVQGADGDQQRASGGPEFGPHLGAEPLGLVVLVLDGTAGPGQRHGGQPGVPRTGAPGPVHQRGGGPEHDGRRFRHPPLQQSYEMGAGALGIRPVVPGDHEGRAAPAEREDCAEGGVQPVRVHQVGVRAGRPERGDGAGVAAARHLHVFGADPAEAVEVIGLRGGAHGDPHASRHEPRGQRSHMHAAAGVASAQHLHGAQRRLAVR